MAAKDLVWVCLVPTCEFTSLDDDEIFQHERREHPEFMRLLRETLAVFIGRDAEIAR